MKRFVDPLRPRASAGEMARKVTWLELFFDLVFVAAVAQVASPLHEHYDLPGVGRFAVLFALIWWAWNGHTVFATRFHANDLLHRLLTLVQMFIVAAMAANAGDTLDSTSAAGFAAAYAVLRFVLVAQQTRALRVPGARAYSRRTIAGHGAAACLWLASALVPVPLRFWIWSVALAIDLATPWIAMKHSLRVPPDAHHLPERFGLFTLILLGESIVSVMHGMESHEHWSSAAGTAAFLSMALVFVIWWWYFEGAAATAERPVATKRDAVRQQLWSYAHYPLYLGVVLTGVGAQRIVSAAARMTIPQTDAFIVLGGAALLMMAMAVIAETAGGRRHRTTGRLFPWTLSVAAATLLIALAGPPQSPVALIVGVSFLCATQLALALGRRAAAT